jgi:hypothetical protein
MGTGMFINSGVLFEIAKRAYDRARDAAPHDRSPDSSDSLVAIVFSAVAAEAFINEIGELASQPDAASRGLGLTDPDEVKSLARLLSEVEDSRGSTNLKFLIGKLALVGQTFDKGVNPYQDLATLLELRNSLVHLKFDRWDSLDEVVHPPVVSRLRSKNCLAEFEGESVIASWVTCVSTPAVARWACNATAAIVKDVVDSIPASDLRKKANFLYYTHDKFAPVV